MKPRNILTVLGTAVLTVAVTLSVAALWSPGVAQADIKAVITRPELKSQECKFVVSTDKASYEANESPKIAVTATNPTNETRKVKVWVNVMSSGPADPRSRIFSVLPIAVSALPSGPWHAEHFNLNSAAPSP